MRTSKIPSRVTKIIYAIISVVLFFLLNSLLCFILIPPVGSSEKMWALYRQQQELDMVYTGTSLCYAAIDNSIIDSVLGTKSFNMATASQELNNTYEAIETAIKDHKIKRAVLTFSYLNLIEYNNVQAETCFFKERIKWLPFPQKIKESVKFAFDKKHFSKPTSINFLFPWIFSHVKFRPYRIIENTKDKMNKNTESYQNIYNTINVSADCTLDYNTVGNENSKTVYVGLKYNFGKFTGEVFDQLEKIITLCKQNDVDLMLINPPKPRQDVLCYGEEYFTLNKFVNEYAKKQGFDYYDFNIIKPEIFENHEDYYSDFEHVNIKGQKAFSTALAKFILLRDEAKETGTSLSYLFYTQDEYFETIKDIACIYFDLEQPSARQVDFTAHAYTGKNVTVLYQALVKKQSDKEFSVINNYSAQNIFTFIPKEAGTYTIRVNAKTSDSQKDYDRYYEQQIVIK